MAEQKDYDKLAVELHRITGELPQTWVKANEGFIVILVSDSTKKSHASFPVLIRRRMKPDGTDLITNEMVLAALEAGVDPIHAIQTQELICFGDERYRSVNELLPGHLGITINNMHMGHTKSSTCCSIGQTLALSAMYQGNEAIRKIHLSPLQRATAASVLLGHLNKEDGWYYVDWFHDSVWHREWFPRPKPYGAW